MRTVSPIAVVACLMLTASPLAAAESVLSNAMRPCVDVQIGSDRSAYLNCLNDAMQRSVERERAVPQPTAPVDARSSSNRVGTFNDAAARQQMGNSYGVSPVPQRPSGNFVSPLVPPAAR